MEQKIEEEEEDKNKKLIRNKISCLLISFYSGICVISDIGVKYYFKDKKKVDTAVLSKLLLLFKIPYLLKPLYGFLLDFFPLCGYKKKYYLFLCFFMNIISWYIFIISNNASLYTSIICQFFINISLSFTTLIGSAIQVEISKMYDHSKNIIGERTTELMSTHFIVKSIGTLIPSYLKGFLIEKYTNNIIFYISGLISFFIFTSAIILDEDRIKNHEKTERKKSIKFSPLIEEEANSNENKTTQIINLIKDKNIIILLSLILVLESSPSCVSPLFYYETNILGLNPRNLSLIDFFCQISIIIVIIIYNYLCLKLNFKCLTFFVRISLFIIFYLIYMLIMKITQEYISDLSLITFTSSLYEGLHSLGKLPYYLLAIQLSPLTLEATTYSLCVFSCYLGNIFADCIDYFLAIYFKVTHHNFDNLGILVLIENILNLIPLLYTLSIPNKFFSEIRTKSQNPSTKELLEIEQKNQN